MKQKQRYITLKLDPEEYRQWQLHVKEKYGIEPAGRYSKIGEINARMFSEKIKEEMGK